MKLHPKIGHFYRCTSKNYSEIVIAECTDIVKRFTHYEDGKKEYLNFEMRDIAVLRAEKDTSEPTVWEVSDKDDIYIMKEVTQDKNPEYFL